MTSPENLIISLSRNQDYPLIDSTLPEKFDLYKSKMVIKTRSGELTEKRTVLSLNVDDCISFDAYSTGADISDVYLIKVISLDSVLVLRAPFLPDCEILFDESYYKGIYIVDSSTSSPSWK
jgi:hypothetical protein